MNKHLKIAIFVTPVLIILGYFAAGSFTEPEVEEKPVKPVVQLKPSEDCDIMNDNCKLNVSGLKVNVFNNEHLTSIKTTRALDGATIFLVDENDNATPFKMAMIQNPYYWHAQTNLNELVERRGQSHKLRLIVEIEGRNFISEFTTVTK